MRQIGFVLGLALLAQGALAGDGAMPDEIGIFGIRIQDKLTDPTEAWNGLGGRAGWQVAGPILAEVDVWNASEAGSSAQGFLLSGRVLMEGLVTGVFARASVGRYRGQSTMGIGVGAEFYVVKQLVLRGEAQMLRPGDEKDLALTFGLGFRL